MKTTNSRLPASALALRARWVVPIDRPPLDGGMITIVDGRIAAVGTNDSSLPPQDLGDVALLPGLVNAHTHLEFSQLTQPLGQPGNSFPEWIRHVVAWRRLAAASATAAEQYAQRAAAVRMGLAETQAAGVAAVGDIASPLWPAEAYAAFPDVSCTVFGELLGLSAQRQGEAAALADEMLAAGPLDAPTLRVGLSPHAPYTVHPNLLNYAVQRSVAHRIPLAMHLAESSEELQLLAEHRGPFVELLQSLAAWHPDVLPTARRPLDYLQSLAEAHRALVIHGNYLSSDEIEFIAARRERMSVVYCPRTHSYFGHNPYPLAKTLAAGVRVAVGTDSRASSPDLSLLEELRHIARQHPAVSLDRVLHLGTLAGAEALGIAADFGSITPGKRAEIAVVPLPTTGNSPLETILRSDARRAPICRLKDWLAKSAVSVSDASAS